MQTRRDLLKYVSAVAACLTESAHALPRQRTIDVHTHAAFDLSDMLPGTPLEATGAVDPALPRLRVDDTRLHEMDRMNVDIQVLSVNPFWYTANAPLAGRLVEHQNQLLAQCCQRYPGRFKALACVALQYPKLAAAQLEDAMHRHGMRGAFIGESASGVALSDRRFDPFWAKAQALGAVIMMHPEGAAEVTGLAHRVAGNGNLDNIIGDPLETTLALSHLIFDGTLDRFPRLKLCAVHGGGYLLAYPARSDHACTLGLPPCPGPALKQAPTAYLKQLYYDDILFTDEGLRHLIAVAGIGRVMMGSDYPYPWVPSPVDYVLKARGLTAHERTAILWNNAQRLFGPL
jgi:predicted TIM-barrel fold metal-dependent hydrolase